MPRGRDSIVGLLNFLSIKIESNDKEKSIELDAVASAHKIAYELCLFTAVKENLFWKNTKKSVNNQAFIPNFAEQIEFITLSPCEQALHDAAVSRNDPNDSRLVLFFFYSKYFNLFYINYYYYYYFYYYF